MTTIASAQAPYDVRARRIQDTEYAVLVSEIVNLTASDTDQDQPDYRPQQEIRSGD